MMATTEHIREINISKQARALRFLRYTDYLLVILGGFWLVAMLGGFVANPEGIGFFDFVFVSVLSLGVYTGCRHVGVIDERVWRWHMLTFPLIIFVSIFVGTAIIYKILTKESGFNQENVETFGALWAISLLTAGCLLGFVSVWLLRRMRIEYLGVRLVELFANLRSQRGLRAIDVTKIKRVNVTRGMLNGVLGGLILLGAILIPIPAGESKRSFLTIWGKLYLLGFFLLIRARRYFQVSADSLLAVDKRNPILFLRSFGDDEKVKFGVSEKAFLDFSLETRLSNHFNFFGPFIAIGSPKETLPEPGAARVLLPDSEWRPRVMTWMSKASLVIIYSGKTHWVNWELGKVIETESVSNLILMIPEVKVRNRRSRAKEISYRVELAKDVFRDTKWHAALEGIQDFQKLRAMLFHPDGSMTVIKSRPRNRDSYHLAALVAHYIILNEFNQIVPKVAEKLPESSEAKLDKDLLRKEPEKKEEDLNDTPSFLCPSCGERLFSKIHYNKCPYCENLLSERCPKCGTKDVYRAFIEDGGQGDWCPNCKESLQKMRGEI